MYQTNNLHVLSAEPLLPPDELVAGAADRVCWVKLGQLGKIVSFFKENGVAETVFLGTITERAALARDLVAIRERGYATNDA